jgi:hypothetical protein
MRLNRKERRRLAKQAPQAVRKMISRELKGRKTWCEDCQFNRCDHHTMPCACPNHEHPVQDGEGRVVEDVRIRDSGLFVARSRLERPRLERPGGGPRVGPPGP